ncbi:MAG TPA: hypothetical protein VK181_10410, partial [Rhizobium sp.]|nr:hypothetical protein [Rhizobium sp.]
DPSPTNLLRRYRLALSGAGLALLLAGFALFRGSASADAAAELETRRMTTQTAERNLRNAAGLEQHLEVLNKHVPRLEAMLIGLDDVSGNQAYFYRLESNTGVRVVVLRPTGVPKDAPKNSAYVPAGFNIVVQGSYAQVVTFLRALENGERLYRLTDFSLQRANEQSGGKPQVALNLNLQLLAKKS